MATRRAAHAAAAGMAPEDAPGVWPLLRASQMRALDAFTIDTQGISGELLMESAGRAVAAEALRLRAHGAGGEIVVVCGHGNNGGDGLVAARHLHQQGVAVRAAVSGDPEALRGDAAANLRRARAVGVPVDGERWRAPAARGLVIDAIFGTGLSREVRGAPAQAIRRIAQARAGGARVLAVDLPSGLDADTGQPWGTAVAADVTVTIEAPKCGLALEPGRTLAGRVRVARVGIARAAPELEPDTLLWSARAAAAALPARPADGHKGTFGHVLVVAGSRGKTGAAALAARGAGRGGAGLVTVACPASLDAILETLCVEAMTVPVADDAAQGFAAEALEPLLALAAERDAVVLGPGIGRGAGALALARALASRCDRPLVLDADGLFALAAEPERLRARRAPTVLTPHPGEAARLLGVDAAAVNRDRPAAARRLAERSGAVVVLKGAATVIAGPSGSALVNPTGGPALASGGTGDVLAGLVGALLAQDDAGRARVEPHTLQRAALAAWLHGHAADRLAARCGDAGLLAGEVADALPAARHALRERARVCDPPAPDAAPRTAPPADFVLDFPEP